MQPLRISGKRLGYLAQPEACERCFWLQARMGWRLPYSMFAGIFSSIDSYSKKATAAHYALRGSVPQWLGFEGTPIAVPHHSQFQSDVKSHGIVLSGAPDEIIRRSDGTLVIVDYKTSRATVHQDELMPTYTTQLNAYGLIAEAIGLGKVSGLYLVYYEPQTQLEHEPLLQLMDEDGFKMRFQAHVVQVPLQLMSVMTLLKKARRIYSHRSPPLGRTDCKECLRAAHMAALLTKTKIPYYSVMKRPTAKRPAHA